MASHKDIPATRPVLHMSYITHTSYRTSQSHGHFTMPSPAGPSACSRSTLLRPGTWMTPCLSHRSRGATTGWALALCTTPCTLHPAACTLHPAPCTLHPAPCTVNPVACSTDAQVGVHIADVSYFVREETALDGSAADRSTSTYLVDQVQEHLDIPSGREKVKRDLIQNLRTTIFENFKISERTRIPRFHIQQKFS